MRTTPAPNRSHLASALLAGLATLLAGCAAHTPEVAVPAAASVVTSSPVRAIDPAFAAGRNILSGLDIAAESPDDSWQIGDSVLLGLRSNKAGQTTARFLLIELLDVMEANEGISFTASPRGRPKYEFRSPAVLTRLTLFDEQGNKTAETRGRFPKRLLGYGLYDGVESSVNHPELRGKEDLTTGLSQDEYDRTMRGWLTMFSFSGSMGKKGLFRDMLYDVIARPTWLAMLLNPSVSLGFGDTDWPQRAEPFQAGAAQLESLQVPLVCMIAGKKAAVAQVLAARPTAPLSLCGGVTQVMVHNADDPSVTMEVYLLAAKRGQGGREFQVK